MTGSLAVPCYITCVVARASDPNENGFVPKDSLGTVLAALAAPTTLARPSAAASSSSSSSGSGGGGGGAGDGMGDGVGVPLLSPAIAGDVAVVSALAANLETAGAGIILWDDFWRSVT